MRILSTDTSPPFIQFEWYNLGQTIRLDPEELYWIVLIYPPA
jgi:hypothetical protein